MMKPSRAVTTLIAATNQRLRATRWTKLCLAVYSGLAIATVAPRAEAAKTTSASASGSVQKVPGSRAFAQVTVPKRTLYVGELVPITIRAYYAAGTGVTVTATPSANTPDFTLSVGDFKQGSASTASGAYAVATWAGHLSPAKPGQYRLKVEIPSELEWRTVKRRVAPAPSDMDDLFGDMSDPFGGGSLFGGGDPFAAMQRHMQQLMSHTFEDIDLGSVHKQSIVLKSPDVPLTVLPLPAEGRPPNFSGAVGHFKLEASVDSTQVRAGEPLELRLAVNGDGNFDRVTTPGLPESDQFKTYTPSVKGLDHGKTFVQAVVPQRPGTSEIPPVELTFFDPDEARYLTARSTPIPIEVKPGLALATTRAGVAPEVATGPPLAPNAELEGRPVASLQPLYLRRSFWLAQLAPFGLLGFAAGLVAHRRRAASDPHHALKRSARRGLRLQREAMHRAMSVGDVSAFFAAARGALQHRLGAAWGMVPEAITLAEIERRVQEPQLGTLRGVFEADAARFGVGLQNQDLVHWNDAVCRVLARPEGS